MSAPTSNSDFRYALRGQATSTPSEPSSTTARHAACTSSRPSSRQSHNTMKSADGPARRDLDALSSSDTPPPKEQDCVPMACSSSRWSACFGPDMRARRKSTDRLDPAHHTAGPRDGGRRRYGSGPWTGFGQGKNPSGGRPERPVGPTEKPEQSQAGDRRRPSQPRHPTWRRPAHLTTPDRTGPPPPPHPHPTRPPPHPTPLLHHPGPDRSPHPTAT